METPVMSLHNIGVSEFLAALDACKGSVFLLTRDGDKLNLKSRLSQLIGLTKLIKGGKITEAFIICDNAEDESRFFRLNMFGESVRTA